MQDFPFNLLSYLYLPVSISSHTLIWSLGPIWPVSFSMEWISFYGTTEQRLDMWSFARFCPLPVYHLDRRTHQWLRGLFSEARSQQRHRVLRSLLSSERDKQLTIRGNSRTYSIRTQTEVFSSKRIGTEPNAFLFQPFSGRIISGHSKNHISLWGKVGKQ